MFYGNLVHISKHGDKHNFRVKIAFSLSISTLNLDHLYAYRGSLCALNSENVIIRIAAFCNLEILSVTEMSLDVHT